MVAVSPKRGEGESKWIKAKYNVEANVVLRQCMRARCGGGAAAAAHSSRHFCSVTAVVCRQFSHMTRGGAGGGLHPSSQCLLFLGKMAAIVLLLPVSHMNRRGWGVGGKPPKLRAYEVCVVPQ